MRQSSHSNHRLTLTCLKFAQRRIWCMRRSIVFLLGSDHHKIHSILWAALAVSTPPTTTHRILHPHTSVRSFFLFLASKKFGCLWLNGDQWTSKTYLLAKTWSDNYKMSSSGKIAPALTLGGRFWRLQKEAGLVVKSQVSASFGWVFIHETRTIHSEILFEPIFMYAFYRNRSAGTAGGKMTTNSFSHKASSSNTTSSTWGSKKSFW